MICAYNDVGRMVLPSGGKKNKQLDYFKSISQEHCVLTYMRNSDNMNHTSGEKRFTFSIPNGFVKQAKTVDKYGK